MKKTFLKSMLIALACSLASVNLYAQDLECDLNDPRLQSMMDSLGVVKASKADNHFGIQPVSKSKKALEGAATYGADDIYTYSDLYSWLTSSRHGISKLAGMGHPMYKAVDYNVEKVSTELVQIEICFDAYGFDRIWTTYDVVLRSYQGLYYIRQVRVSSEGSLKASFYTWETAVGKTYARHYSDCRDVLKSLFGSDSYFDLSLSTKAGFGLWCEFLEWVN